MTDAKPNLCGMNRSELIGLIGKYEIDALAWRAYRRTAPKRALEEDSVVMPEDVLAAVEVRARDDR